MLLCFLDRSDLNESIIIKSVLHLDRSVRILEWVSRLQGYRSLVECIHTIVHVEIDSIGEALLDLSLPIELRRAQGLEAMINSFGGIIFVVSYRCYGVEVFICGIKDVGLMESTASVEVQLSQLAFRSIVVIFDYFSGLCYSFDAEKLAGRGIDLWQVSHIEILSISHLEVNFLVNFLLE